jgi:hypothetical protein
VRGLHAPVVVVDQSGGGVKIMCVHRGHQSINDFAHADLPAVRTPVRRPIVHRPVARTGTDPQRQTPGRAVDTGVGRASASTHSVPRLALPLPIDGAICADRRAACTSRAPSAARFRTWGASLGGVLWWRGSHHRAALVVINARFTCDDCGAHHGRRDGAPRNPVAEHAIQSSSLSSQRRPANGRRRDRWASDGRRCGRRMVRFSDGVFCGIAPDVAED